MELDFSQRPCWYCADTVFGAKWLVSSGCSDENAVLFVGLVYGPDAVRDQDFSVSPGDFFCESLGKLLVSSDDLSVHLVVLIAIEIFRSGRISAGLPD